MAGFHETLLERDDGSPLKRRLRDLQGARTRRRVEELQHRIASLRAALAEAEAELAREEARVPSIGDFVRCPLTNFFGRVIRVTPRPHGRPWVEILPYLGENLPGHMAMDLYDSWELMDPPGGSSEAEEPAQPPPLPETVPRLPKIKPFEPLRAESAEEDRLADEIEALVEDLRALPNTAQRRV